MSAKMISLD